MGISAAAWAAIGAIGGGAAAATGSLIGAGETAGATKSAAQTQANAATQAAQLQSTTAANTLAFEKQQAAQDLATQNATNLANYNQWAARQNRLSAFGQTIGLPAENIPAFSPIPNTLTGTTTVPTSATSLPTGASGTSASASASGNPTDPSYIQNQLTALYQSLGVQPTGRGTGPTDIAYYADQIANTGGWQGGNIGYWTNRITSDVRGTGGNGAAASTTPGTSSPQNALSNYLVPTQAAAPSVPMAALPPATYTPPSNSLAALGS